MDTIARKGPIQRQQHDIGEQTPRNGEAVYERDANKETPQEIVHRARPTTLSLSHPYATKDRTEPYLAKPSKGSCQGLQGEQALDVQEPALFLRDRLYEGLYCRRKGKGYATEVVSNEKLSPNGLEGRLR